MAIGDTKKGLALCLRAAGEQRSPANDQGALEGETGDGVVFVYGLGFSSWR